MSPAGANELFQGILEAAPDAMLVTDEEGVIVLVNRMTELLFGYDRLDLVGHKVELLVPKDVREEHAHQRIRFHASPEARAMGSRTTIQGRHANGSTFPVDISLSPLQRGEETLVIVAVRDLTAQLRREQRHERLRERVMALERQLDLVRAGNPFCPDCGHVWEDAEARLVPVDERRCPHCED